MGRILITEMMEDAAVARLAAQHDVTYQPDLVDRQGDIPELVADADGLIVRNRTQVTRGMLDRAPRLRVIGRLGVGLDNIDMEACDDRSISVRPAVGANAVAVAEYVIAAMLTLLRPVYSAAPLLLAGGWPRRQLVGREAAGTTLGLVGYGSIARNVARRANALDQTVIAYDPLLESDTDWSPAQRTSLDVLVESSDIISIHVPLLPDTRNLFDRARLRQMQRGAFLINAARGGIVDEEALADALASGHLGGAALDVFDSEPPTAARLERLRPVPNLILTPHIAGVTAESNERVSAMVAEAVLEELGS